MYVGRTHFNFLCSAEIVDYSYLDDMNREVLQLQGQLQQLEVKAFNTSSKDEQFSMITVDEVWKVLGFLSRDYLTDYPNTILILL
jgi:hypothetical protein